MPRVRALARYSVRAWQDQHKCLCRISIRVLVKDIIRTSVRDSLRASLRDSVRANFGRDSGPW